MHIVMYCERLCILAFAECTGCGGEEAAFAGILEICILHLLHNGYFKEEG